MSTEVITGAQGLLRARENALQAEKEILSQLRLLRSESSLTTRDLAKLVRSRRITHSLITQIEHGKVGLGLELLSELAEIYLSRIRCSKFKTQQSLLEVLLSQAAVSVPKRRRDQHRIQRTNTVIDSEISPEFFDITPIGSGHQLRFVRIVYSGRCRQAGAITPHYHPGQELVCVVKGSLELQIFNPRNDLSVGWREIRVSRGGEGPFSACFPAHLPHRFRSTFDGESEIIAVYFDPRGKNVSSPKLFPTDRITGMSSGEFWGFIVGVYVGLYRLRLGLSYSELAEMTGIGQRRLAELERGKSSVNLLESISIAEALGRDLVDIFDPRPQTAQFSSTSQFESPGGSDCRKDGSVVLQRLSFDTSPTKGLVAFSARILCKSYERIQFSGVESAFRLTIVVIGGEVEVFHLDGGVLPTASDCEMVKGDGFSADDSGGLLLFEGESLGVAVDHAVYVRTPSGREGLILAVLEPRT